MAEKRSRGELRNGRLQKVAAHLFLKHGYNGVTLDRIVEQAGGSQTTIYSEFGGKCGLFIRSIETLCRESNDCLSGMDYTGLNLEQSLTKLGYQILKLITSKKSIELHRLAIAEAANCPEVGEAWYTHGPAKTTSFIRHILEAHQSEFQDKTVSLDRIAVMLHDSLTGDILNRRLAAISQHETDMELLQTAGIVVNIVLASARRSRRAINQK